MTQTTTLATTPDAYTQATRTAADYVCGQCGGNLVVIRRDHEWAPACAGNPAHRELKSIRDAQREEVQARMDRNPDTAQALAVQGAHVPLTSQAIRELDNAKLLARIPARYGASDLVTSDQRLQIAQLARLYCLDPLFDLMIYEHRPYVTYDGRLRKLREHPEYRGHKVHPLDKAEKELWDYESTDIVIQCDVDMGPRGIVTEWGVVRRTEIERARGFQRPPPVGTHPQQIALKRAVGRASRMAVGIDLPTMIEGTGHVIDVERVDTRRQLPPDAEASARARFWATARGGVPDGLGLTDEQVHEILGVDTVTGYPGGWDQALSDLTERALEKQALEDVPEGQVTREEVPTEPLPTTPAGPMPESMAIPTDPARRKVTAKSAVAVRLQAAIDLANEVGIPFDEYRVIFPAAEEEVIRKAERLEELVRQKQRELAGDRDTEVKPTDAAGGEPLEQLPSF